MDDRDQLAARAIEGGWHPDGDQGDAVPLHDAITALFRTYGSQDKAAAALGIPRRTLRRWRDESIAGRQPQGAEALRRRQTAGNRIVEAVERHRLPEDRRAVVRGWSTVRLTADVTYSEDSEEERDFTFGAAARGKAALDPGAFDAMLDRYLDGDPEVFGAIEQAMDPKYREILSRNESDEPHAVITRLRFS